MSQPKWKLLDNLGDNNPINYGGLFVYVDETGVYAPEMEQLEVIGLDKFGDSSKWIVHRIVLEPCTFIDGVLSDNPYHKNHPAWFAHDIESVCSLMDVKKRELIGMLCSDEPLKRAEGWRCLIGYHNLANFDGEPLTFTSRKELGKRYHSGELN